MDFTNLDQGYIEFWAGIDQTNYINELINIGNQFYNLGIIQAPFDSNILQPEYLFPLVNNISNYILLVPAGVLTSIASKLYNNLPESIDYQTLYNDFVFNIFLIYDTLQSAGSLSTIDQTVSEALTLSVNTFKQLAKNAGNILQPVTSTIFFMGLGLVAIYYVLQKA